MICHWPWTVRELHIPFGIIVNRMGSGDSACNFVKRKGFPSCWKSPTTGGLPRPITGILMVDAAGIPATRSLTEKISKRKERKEGPECQHEYECNSCHVQFNSKV